MNQALIAAALAAALSMIVAPASAHEDAALAAQKAPNGGQLRQAGPLHYELVVTKGAKASSESPVIVYVTDHAGNKIPTAGATGTATLLGGKLKATATLKPDGDNRLSGLAKYAATADLKVVVAVTLAGKAPEQARFTPLAAATDGHTDHSH